MSSRHRERGSALLIVFVFSAMIAVMLYMELPVAVFEARRQEEQLLVDRGNEYAHAVKLFVRKVGRYPTSISELEDTNRMRFLRQKYKDPFTGKDDWRLLHVGPGGVLLDSKVANANPLSGNSKTQSLGAFGSSFGSTASTPSGNTASIAATNTGTGTFGSSSSAAPEVVVPPVPQRSPAVAANGAGAGQTAHSSEADLTSGVAPSPTEVSAQAEQGVNATLTAATDLGGANANGPQQTNGTPGPAANGTPGAAANGIENAAANGGASGAQAGTSPTGVQPAPNAAQPGVGPNGVVRNGQAGGVTPAGGITLSGGLAGVASKAQGRSIRIINDQTDYSLWEFYYSPQNDTTGGGRALPGTAPQQPGAPQQNGNTSGFGQQTGSGFSISPGGLSSSSGGGAAPQSATPAQPPQ